MEIPEDVDEGHTVALTVLGCVVGVWFPRDGALLDDFRAQWSRAHAPADAEPVSILRVPEDCTDAEALHQLSTMVTVAAIEARAGDLWMLHAAGLADPVTGATIALVAPSGTGKTTAAARLGRRWAYLSDETVGIAADGSVVAHPKPLSVVQAGDWVKQQVGPDALGLVDAAAGGSGAGGSGAVPRLRAVVLLDRDGTSPPASRPVRRAEAITRLAEQTSFLGHLERPLHTLDAILELTDGVWEVRYDDAEELEPFVASLLARPAS